MAALSFKGRHFQPDMILQSVRWDLAYSLRYRDSEELMPEHGFSVEHRTLNRWSLHYSPQLEATFRLNKKRVGNRWRRDETSIKVKGQGTYYDRALDKPGQTIDFLLPATRDTQAALRFVKKAINANCNPSLVHMDQSGANPAGLTQLNREYTARSKIRPCKYLNNSSEQDHRCIKRLTRPMLGFKNFPPAQRTLAGSDVMAMIKKGQIHTSAGDATSPPERF